jgi:hypothetical protein
MRHRRILIVASFVFALLITIAIVYSSVYSSQQASCPPGVCTIWLGGVTPQLHAGTTASKSSTSTSSLILTLDNPGHYTTIISMNLTGSGIFNITEWMVNKNGANETMDFAASYASGGSNALGGGIITVLTIYPYSSSAQVIAKGETLHFFISFANGQSIFDTLVAE